MASGSARWRSPSTVDDRARQGPPVAAREVVADRLGGDLAVVEDDPVDVVHDVERGVVDRLVLAQAQGPAGTGTVVFARPPEMILCSRAMSWAVASTAPRGGRRRTRRRPSAPVTLKVRLEWPPVMNSKVKGAAAPAMLSASQAETGPASMPLSSVAAASPSAPGAGVESGSVISRH